MLVTRYISELRIHLDKHRPDPVGFVPTMGALHIGHLSLMKKAVSETRVVVVSIFVNPTQFNDKEDLKNYPRTEKEDLLMLGSIMRTEDAVFIPAVDEIYPEEDKRVFDFGNLSSVMEGLFRPGHFNGVAQVVTKLFDIVKPDMAFFGQKDFQQLAIVKELVRQTGNNVTVIGCPIVREPDGLAMSSRNRLLEPGMRKNAGIIYSTISAAANMINEKEIGEIKEFVASKINSTEGFRLEYFEIVDDNYLNPVNVRKDLLKGIKYYCCVALRAGKIRLIDNVEIPLL